MRTCGRMDGVVGRPQAGVVSRSGASAGNTYLSLIIGWGMSADRYSDSSAQCHLVVSGIDDAGLLGELIDLDVCARVIYLVTGYTDVARIYTRSSV